MATPIPPKLLGVDVYMPDGSIKKFKAGEVAAYGMSPAGSVVATKVGDKFTRYCGFPVVIHEELSALVVADAPGTVL